MSVICFTMFALFASEANKMSLDFILNHQHPNHVIQQNYNYYGPQNHYGTPNTLQHNNGGVFTYQINNPNQNVIQQNYNYYGTPNHYGTPNTLQHNNGGVFTYQINNPNHVIQQNYNYYGTPNHYETPNTLQHNNGEGGMYLNFKLERKYANQQYLNEFIRKEKSKIFISDNEYDTIRNRFPNIVLPANSGHIWRGYCNSVGIDISDFVRKIACLAYEGNTIRRIVELTRIYSMNISVQGLESYVRQVIEFNGIVAFRRTRNQ